MPEQHTNAAASPLSKANWQVVLYRYGTHLAVFEFATMRDYVRLVIRDYARLCATPYESRQRNNSLPSFQNQKTTYRKCGVTSSRQESLRFCS
ncbi:hypothetical protein ACU7RR_004292 [Providencia stuartii]